jgi:S1-C subfamily serine protease
MHHFNFVQFFVTIGFFYIEALIHYNIGKYGTLGISFPNWKQNKLIIDHPELKKIIPNTYGLLIRKDPAELPVGIEVWDTIVGVNNIPVNNGVEFSDQLIKYDIGTKIELTLIRNKRYIQVEVPLKVLPLQTELMYGKKLLIPPKKIP